ncbi:43443_t:CDS:2 [Gigaspora margarita]|uniref:43443_t:CDS:1 n=1 Tax=Gigaspora margarita TaxID=4874 RepID=A0ABN7UMQ3_GIGMA|nr:43443_t:CDS:2 [Gigaspora margarita]
MHSIKKDKLVAEYLDIEYPEIVWLIRRLLEKAEWLKLRDIKNKIYKEEVDLLDRLKSELEIFNKKWGKEVLLLTECRVFDYGIKEVQKSLAKKQSYRVAKHKI